MKYKNLHTYNEFLNKKNMINEGLFGKLFKWLSGKIQEYAKKVEASKKIDPIIEESKKNMNVSFDEKFKLLLKKDAEEKGIKASATTPDATQTTTQTATQTDAPATTPDATQTTTQTATQTDAPATGQQTNESNKTKQKTPIDEAIDSWLELTRKKLDPFIKDKEGKIIPINNMYAQAKLVELQELILKRKIEYYKEELKVDATKLIATEQEELKKKSETIIAEIDKAINKKDGQEQSEKPTFEIDKEYNYTRDDKTTTTVTIKEIEDDGKSVTKVVDADNNEFNPETSRIKPIEKPQEKK